MSKIDTAAHFERLVSEGHTPTRASAIALDHASRTMTKNASEGPSDVVQLAARVLGGTATITDLADKIALTNGCGRDQAFGVAERMIRQANVPDEPRGHAAVLLSGASSIVKIADQIQAEQGVNREVAFSLAEKQLRSAR